MMIITWHRSNHVTNICWNQKKKEQPDMTTTMNRYKEPYANHLTLRRMLRSFNKKVNSKMNYNVLIDVAELEKETVSNTIDSARIDPIVAEICLANDVVFHSIAIC